MSSTPLFDVNLSYQGRVVPLVGLTTATTARELTERVRSALQLETDASLKLLYKGKNLLQTPDAPAFSSVPRKTPKVLVLVSTSLSVAELNNKRSDPTIRGFDQERQPNKTPPPHPWGTVGGQDGNYKFCRFEACTWQSFGHRAVDQKTPHAFEALQVLHKLAHDPGIVSVMKERELVVGKLAEMDPIDDRLKQNLEKKGGCLLGYNENGGSAIYLKLRPDSLEGFLPYPQICATLLHELSHNWVGEHNLLFWTNFGQMRAEYLFRHASLAAAGQVVEGATPAQLAGISDNSTSSIAPVVLTELKRDMAQHGLSPDVIAPAIVERCRELNRTHEAGTRLGGGSTTTSSATTRGNDGPRERALAAAEQRARQEKESPDSENNNNMQE